MYLLSFEGDCRSCHTTLLPVLFSHMVTPSCKRLGNSRQPCAQLKIGNLVTMEVNLGRHFETLLHKLPNIEIKIVHQ